MFIRVGNATVDLWRSTHLREQCALRRIITANPLPVVYMDTSSCRPLGRIFDHHAGGARAAPCSVRPPQTRVAPAHAEL